MAILHFDAPKKILRGIKNLPELKRVWDKIAGDKPRHVVFGTSFTPKKRLRDRYSGKRLGEYHMHTGAEEDPSYLDKETMKERPGIDILVLESELVIYQDGTQVPYNLVNSGRRLITSQANKMEDAVKSLRERLDKICREHTTVPWPYVYSQLMPVGVLTDEETDAWRSMLDRVSTN